MLLLVAFPLILIFDTQSSCSQIIILTLPIPTTAASGWIFLQIIAQNLSPWINDIKEPFREAIPSWNGLLEELVVLVTLGQLSESTFSCWLDIARVWRWAILWEHDIDQIVRTEHESHELDHGISTVSNAVVGLNKVISELVEVGLVLEVNDILKHWSAWH